MSVAPRTYKIPNSEPSGGLAGRFAVKSWRISYQMTRATEASAENKKAIELTNTGIDRVVESLGGKLDTMIDSVNKVSTQVQVLSSKLDNIQGKPDKTIFRMPVVKP